MSYQILLEKKALQDIRKMTSSGRKIDIAKLHLILEELKHNPKLGTGNPEPLKHSLIGFWSRRINKKRQAYL
ncbi:type II toxin-antitoxin system YoeB family toxin [Desulfobacula sp.]|jgi:toxin YoeB|uniref:type II toxin-antitoxin system YoeB family toxin n=1 Tax=Desulfobacula sp. TaxID=2593537 RepID=UPI0039B8970F